jgi:thioredoxin reductase
MSEQVVIIGAGPAGLAAAIQLKRYGIEALVLEKDAVGGLLRNANLVENYPGFPGGINGGNLVHLFSEQAHSIGIRIAFENVQVLDYADEKFHVETEKNTYSSIRVVVASGTKPRRFLRFEIPSQLSDHVFYEIYSLMNISGKRIAIVGAGDAAFDYALNLANANEIVILNRGATVRCLPLLWERACEKTSIQYQKGAAIQEVLPADSGKILIKYGASDSETSISVDYLIGAIGREPRLDFLSDRILENLSKLGDRGLLYFVGDVKNDIYRQTSIAVGDGVLAAMKIYRREVEDAL